MNTKYFLFLFAIVVFLVLVLGPTEISSDPLPDPGRRKSSSGSSGGWFGSSKKTSGFGSKKKNNYGSGTTNYGGKKKSKLKSNLKKAAVIGATAYGAYQLGKLSGQFSSSGFGGWNHGGQHYGYNDWNRWREVDGFMCRNDQDCNWMDQRLYCQDYELDFSPMRGWFGGDYMSIVGECSCPHSYRWNDYEMYCEYSVFTGASIAAVVVGIVVLMCCCCAGCFIARKMFS